MKTEAAAQDGPPALEGTCCGRSLGTAPGPERTRIAVSPASGRGTDRTKAVNVPGGRAEVGTDRPVFAADGEGPQRTVRVVGFWMDEAAVTNARFSRFVADTGYTTDAEAFGWSFVFERDVAGGAEGLDRVPTSPWWCKVDGASWRHPEGPASAIDERADHPVVHVSHNDACAFAAWAGGRLPSEAEWEHAARGGCSNIRYPWGDEDPNDLDFLPCNIWQGTFPKENSGADGYITTAPARSFEPNGFGLYNMCGNVWEWCADPFRVRSVRRQAQELNAAAGKEGRRLLKGGSFLCHSSYCHRYRIAARIGNTPDSSTGHMGFRLAYVDPGSGAADSV